MKLKDKYNDLSNLYSEYIVLIKSGNFYLTFGDSAKIMNYLFSYQIINEKLGFPLNSLDKVSDLLNTKKINYLIYDDDSNTYDFGEDNKYLDTLNEVEQFDYNNLLEKMLLNKIKYLIKKDFSNYLRIKDFVDGIK